MAAVPFARPGRLLVAGTAVLLTGLVLGTPAGGARTSAASTGTVTPGRPAALALARGGRLYIGDAGRNEILEWVASRGFRLIAGTGAAGLTGDGGPAASAEIDDPDSLVVTSDGTLYFAQTGRYRAPVSSSGGMRNTVIREITPAGTIRTIAGLHPSCASGPVRSIPAESALFYGASLSLSPSGALAVDASLCVGEPTGPGFGPNLLLTSSGRFVKETSNPVPAVASVACGSGVPGRGFHVFACESGGARAGHPHPKELLVVRSDGSSVAHPAFRLGEFAVGDGEVVSTYDLGLVRVTRSRLVPLLTHRELRRALRTRLIWDLLAPAVDSHGDIYFVASIENPMRSGCQSLILERTARGAIRRIWASPASHNEICY
ncbi:MAG TPA: hypothetical protein VLW49_03765 [Gaiellaceae bacterium]|nr:hypothetical protein [Gaiellaceae bacterium]